MFPIRIRKLDKISVRQTYPWKARFAWAFWRYIRFQDQHRGSWEISKKVTILLQKLRCTQQNDVARGALTAAAAADGQLAYSWMHAKAPCCTAHGPDSPPRRGPVPKLLWADLLDSEHLQCFDSVGLVIWPVKIVPEMTYNVSSGTLNPTHSLTNYAYVAYGLLTVDLQRGVGNTDHRE